MRTNLDVAKRQPLCPPGADFRVTFYDEHTLGRCEQAILQVLQRTGVRFGSPKALDILEEHGAAVDRASGVVRFAPELVKGAPASAPRSFVLGSREGCCDLDLAGRETFNTTNGCGTEVIDWHSGVRRTSTKADLAAITRLTDYLGSVQFWWPIVAAGDCGAPLEVARERGLAILEGYRPEPLGEDKQRELRRIVAAADAELRD